LASTRAATSPRPRSGSFSPKRPPGENFLNFYFLFLSPVPSNCSQEIRLSFRGFTYRIRVKFTEI
jgi:hypothetical protein